MTARLEVFERATETNLCPRGYLLANPDLRAAFGDDEAAAAQHFSDYGVREDRRQVSAAFLATRSAKLNRFRRTLPTVTADAFPIAFAATPFDISAYENEPSNGVAGFWVHELEFNPEGLYADIGAGLRQLVWPNCAYVEVYPSLTADIIVDPDCRLPFLDASLDGIGCFAVLEHVDKPWLMAAEFARVVRPNGRIFIDWPFMQPQHGYPSHYYNATREGLRAMFADHFEVRELYTGSWQTPDWSINWILNSLLQSVDHEMRERLYRTTLGELAQHIPQDAFWRALVSTMDDRSIATLAAGNQLVGVRR